MDDAEPARPGESRIGAGTSDNSCRDCAWAEVAYEPDERFHPWRGLGAGERKGDEACVAAFHRTIASA